ncbi:Abi family protein [Turicibacter sanguinis]|uniref:Abi family protein n=1 Tax=Turicibacter sanguinis TaxID=154288 RepID=UPI0006C5F003|nr:Abi family protein [Turicibacter sanguinis]MDB8437703.1 Abi family protein [Turicibacter sanguinis]CUN10903.1 Abortive infection bacteriophage resistance protein [Turicibacter sanguinis]
MKPFKTHRQQLTILRSRGLLVNNGSKAIRILERENYYTVINGYKDFFLLRDEKNALVRPERYKDNATFEEIYTLFKFDRELRNCLLEYLLKFEASLKSKISYRFSEKYKDAHAYLIYKNYSRDKGKVKDVLGVIATLSSTLKNKSKNKTISHYLDKHEGVPLWVLVKYLTLGNINYLYGCLTESLRNKIAKDFGDSYNRDYSCRIQFTPQMLDAILKTANFFRNVCAHEERLYNYKINTPSRSRDISRTLNIPIDDINKGNVYSVVIFLKLVLPKSEYRNFIKKLDKLINNYSSQFSSANFNEIMLAMGFNDDWKFKTS